jgi:hypothetical protein
MLRAEDADMRGKATEALLVRHPVPTNSRLLLHMALQGNDVLVAAFTFSQTQQWAKELCCWVIQK